MPKATASPMLVAAFPVSKGAKIKVTTHPKMGESGSPHTQVGEMPSAAKEPTRPERLVETAHEEKHHATRQWMAGRMTTAEHSRIHARANHVIKHKGNVDRRNAESLGEKEHAVAKKRRGIY